jgi:hypothetical protein
MKEIADAAVLGREDALRLLEPVMEERHKEQLRQELDVDLAYAVPGVARFRVNVFREANGFGAALRQIPGKILTSSSSAAGGRQDRARCRRGLIRSRDRPARASRRRLAAMVDLINKTRRGHIITIEDPIEFVHKTQHCLVNQREIGGHARSFGRALRAALREDPDIILVGEMRDAETIMLVLEAANTGHLVLVRCTRIPPSAIDASSTSSADQQAQIRSVLATCCAESSRRLCANVSAARGRTRDHGRQPGRLEPHPGIQDGPDPRHDAGRSGQGMPAQRRAEVSSRPRRSSWTSAGRCRPDPRSSGVRWPGAPASGPPRRASRTWLAWAEAGLRAATHVEIEASRSATIEQMRVLFRTTAVTR